MPTCANILLYYTSIYTLINIILIYIHVWGARTVYQSWASWVARPCGFVVLLGGACTGEGGACLLGGISPRSGYVSSVYHFNFELR